MAAGSEAKTRAGERGRVPYRFTAAQVLKMVEHGILVDDVELWDGVLYRMVKGEPHDYIVSQAADALRDATPAGYHVREEKSCRYGESSLPEPDVAVARGRKHDYLPDPPPLSRLALVVEVDHHSGRADAVTKLARYAAVGIPIYWIIDVTGRCVKAHDAPEGERYANVRLYRPGEDLPIVIDGREAGRVAVADLFPPEAQP